MGSKRPESVLVVIRDKDGRILVLQREDDPEFWQSVTGALEEDELPLDTAFREVFEETGIDLKADGYQLRDCGKTNRYRIRPRWQHRYPPGCTENTEYVFSATVRGDEEIRLTEHLSYQWLPVDEAVARVWSPSNKDAIATFGRPSSL